MNSSATVLRDVSESLRDLIANSLSELTTDSITFLSPGQVIGNKTQLVVFLYRMAKDPFTTNQNPVIREEDDGSFTQLPPPQALNLNYIMVPYSRDPETELIIADQLRALFYNVPALTGDLLLGSLAEAGNQRISIVPKDPPMEKIHNLWTGFSGKPYRLSLFYDLVPTFIPGANTRAVTMVNDLAIGSPEEV